MGVAGSPDVFQEKMNDLMEGLEFVRCYLDNLLTITKGNFVDHLAKLEAALERLSKAGLRVNVSKSSFRMQELEHLGCLLTPSGMKPIAKSGSDFATGTSKDSASAEVTTWKGQLLSRCMEAKIPHTCASACSY